jgi:hypothetical protein
LPKGLYRVSAQAITFGKGYFCSRLQVCQRGLRNPKTGNQIAETGTDTGQIGVCDIRAIKRAYDAAFSDSYEEVIRYFEQNIRSRAGVLTPNGMREARLMFVESGFGDGVGPVFELLSGKKRVGVDAEFISADYRFGAS